MGREGGSVRRVLVTPTLARYVTAKPHDGERLCAACRCVLAGDDTQPVCSPCRRSYRKRRLSGYRPQHDATLRAVILCTLMEHEGERINLYRVLGMWPCGLDEWVSVQGHVRHWRRRGHTIYGYHDGTYLYVGEA